MGADPEAKVTFQHPVATPGKKGPKEVMQEAMNEGLALRGFQMGLGYDTASIQQQQPPVRATESISLNVGDIFKGLADLNVGLAGKLLEKKDAAQNPNEDRLFTYLLAQLDRLQQRQDQALNSQPQDPFTVVFDNLGKYKQVVSTLQQGDPHNMQLAQAGIDIEHLRVEAQMQESRQQHEEKMETMKRQWQREDERWLQEFKLKVHQTESSEKRAQEAGGFIQDLAGALASALEPGTSSHPPHQAIAGRPHLKTFKCRPPHGCGAIVQVPAPNSVEAVCSNCGLTWDLTGEEPPPPPPDLSPVLPPSHPPADFGASHTVPPMQLAEEEMDQ